ncbi:MAG: hypothetical protein JJU29_18160 [Verrucomicrobia bacterium]|nr:hypothetical protein [Verrucomicrobiota bacterium]MCH8514441.1 hypothetical protein [Kiritimatiellia bacterium]
MNATSQTLTRFLVLLLGATTLSAQNVIEEDGRILVEPYPIEEKWLNEWPEAEEEAFWDRANEIIRKHAQPGNYGNKHFENEKGSYPNAFLSFLAGHRDNAIRFLEAEDTQAGAWHQHTEGIDFYAAFTLKGQMRKYYFFSPWLDEDYRARMKRGAEAWTRTDPRTTPHPVFQRYNPNLQGWTPERFGNRQVDGRRTDNLYAMSTTATYLMAEETGNTETRETYRDHINRYVWSLFNIGMGEWDSATYHGHTFAAYLNLYDFAKDEQIKGVAKAALDQMATMMALKYYRGGMVRPTKRDNSFHNKPMGGDLPMFAWIYFGGHPDGADHFERDVVHAMTSAYRPPRAVMALARKDFEKPVEILSTKINYQNWEQDADDSHRPRHFETLYIAPTYMLGSLTPRGPEGDIGPFNLVVENSERGVDYFVAATSSRDNLPRLGIDGGVQMAQYRNLVLWLREGEQGDAFVFQVPESAERETVDGIHFFRFENTWAALRPIHLGDFEVKTPTGRAERALPNVLGLHAPKTPGPYYGFALEVGDPSSHGDYATFKQRVRNDSALDLSELDNGRATLRGADGSFLTLGFPEDGGMAHVNRNGQVRDFDDPAEWALMRTVSGPEILDLGWKEGRLTVNAGGYRFTSEMNREGETSFSEVAE